MDNLFLVQFYDTYKRPISVESVLCGKHLLADRRLPFKAPNRLYKDPLGHYMIKKLDGPANLCQECQADKPVEEEVSV